jgi:hypothetical protein
MTRASLLHILDHVSEISDAEIRELEQLAAAFPYCQTAHILLAKAAHDRGSMLASQRLRRAATYATNRELLRQLLEQPAPAPKDESIVSVQPETSALIAAAPTVSAAEVATTSEPTVEADAVSEPTEAAFAAQEEGVAAPITQTLSSFDTVSADNVSEAPASENNAGEEALLLLENEQPSVLHNEGFITVAPEEKGTLQEEPINNADEQLLADAELTTEVADADQDLVEDFAQLISPSETPTDAGEAAQTSLEPELSESSVTVTTTAELTGLAETEASKADTGVEVLVEDLLPPTAPPIRPPANAGISRFEFDLVEPALPTPSAYQLPGLEEDEEEEGFPLPTIPRTGPPAFHADEELGYALGAGSRLGYDLQPHDGYTLDLPLDSFFEPDALLLAHVAASRPKPTKSSIDLINRFLKAQPRIKSPGNDSKPADEQADLSVRSTQAAPAIASESLAKIMIKQGKIDKAIEIYERLMQRQPEKKAYFADQIQQLKQPSA